MKKVGLEEGFTVIELLLVTAILGVVVTLAYPNFSAFIGHLRLRGAVRDIVADMQFAKFRAISKNRQYRIVFDTTQESYIIEEGDQSIGSSWPGTQIGIERRFANPSNPYYHSGVDIYSSSNNPIFSPRGIISNLTTVKLQNIAGEQFKVTTSLSGYIKSEKGW